MAQDFLERIIKHKKSVVRGQKAFLGSIKDKIDRSKLTRYRIFKSAISKPGKMNLIAEIKKASPSRGLICKNFDVLTLAKTYVDSGADAISILTEDRYFLGKPIYIKTVSENFNLPVLRKDFIIDEVQIYESFTLGASAVLLIVAILEDEQLLQFMKIAAQLDIDCLVEIHNEKELERALKAGAEIIGINNRNLHTFEVDVGVSERLIPLIPKEKIIVAESGISSNQEIRRLKDLGAKAVLIGETFLREEKIAAKIKEVMQGCN